MIGKKLRELRKERGWTQEELGERLHIHRSTVSYWETGFTDPPLEMVRALALLYGVSADYLLGLSPRKRGKRPLSPVTVGSGGIGWSFFIAAVRPQKIPFFLKKRLAFSNWLM